MTTEIAITLAILVVAIVLFVTERLRVDVVALVVLGALALTGLVTPVEALSGFSSPAVVTVGAVLILSAGLARTGVANLIGDRVLGLAGTSEVRLLIIVMLTVGVMSAFMNDIGVAALMLPVVIEITRKVGIPPSKLLIPLAFGALLGGLNTLIGTPPNILVSDILVQYHLEPFRMFDYTPVGLPLMLVGIAFMVIIGRRILPSGDITQEFRDSERAASEQVIDMQERLFIVRLPKDSALSGRTLAESKLGSVLGLNVIGIIRDGQTLFAPGSRDILHAGDQLLVAGRPDRLAELPNRQAITVEDETLAIQDLVSTELEMVEVGLSPRSSLLGQNLKEIDFRRRYGVFVLAIWRDAIPIRSGFDTMQLELGDTLLVYGPRVQLDRLRDMPDFLVSGTEATQLYRLQERLLVITIPPSSNLVGKSLADSRLAEAFGLAVLGIVRDGATRLMVSADEQFQAGDKLLVKGDADNIAAVYDLDDLEMEPGGVPELAEFNSEQAGLVEVVISPRVTFTGETLRQINFREKFGLSVLAIWREGHAYRSNLRDMALHFGDTLLLYGPREKLRVLNRERGFLVLSPEVQEAPRKRKAPLAILIMSAVLLSVIFGWLHIAIAAVIGATLMILTGCLNMEEAYGAIEWKAIFLIAGMLPLGIAMEQSGAARFVAEGVVDLVGQFGPLAIVAGIFILTTLSTEVMPNPAVAVLMGPIVVNTAADLDMSTHALMMTVAVAASAAFISPVGHPVNILVMGPGGYRFKDYLKVGIPLNFVVLGTLLLVLPIFWPLFP